MICEKSSEKKMLIVSNNVLSNVKNNGKTIFSFVDGIDKENVRQLYFHKEKPSICGYSYFQLTDSDILNGILNKSLRGRTWESVESAAISGPNKNKRPKKNHSAFYRTLRDIMWLGHWKSPQLLTWLDEFSPDVVFFVAGNSGFAYNIVRFIAKRYKARLITYITDDYIMSRNKENLIDKIRRIYIKNKMVSCVRKSDEYFTVSEIMQKEYAKIMKKNSKTIVNMTPSLLDESLDVDFHNTEHKVLMYAGSFYYGRDKILGKIVDAVQKYNLLCTCESEKMIVKIYSNAAPTENSSKLFEREGVSSFCGSLGPEELKKALNSAYGLIFVESFDKGMAEKTKYSLSTKVPEYLSVKKPILAVGPRNIGSMDCLSEVSFCAFSEDDIEDSFKRMISNSEESKKMACAARKKYENDFDVESKKKLFVQTCFRD